MQVYFTLALVLLASRVAEGDKYGCGQCYPADQCSRPDLAGKLCWENSAEVIEAVPCDGNNPALSNRGWYCQPNTGTVLVASYDFNNAVPKGLTAMRPTVPAGAEPGALILDPDVLITESVPCDATNPAVAGQWCEPGTSTVAYQCQPCDLGGAHIGLTCRPEPGGWHILKVCMNGGVSATLDINRWVVKTAKYSFLFLPSRHLASAPPPKTDGTLGMPTWMWIVDISMGLILLALGGSTLMLDTAESLVASLSAEIVEEVSEELSQASSIMSSNFDSSFFDNYIPSNWQIIVFDSNGNALGAQNENINIYTSQVGGFKTSNGFEVRW
jgi:hypothetical protein